MYNTANKLQPKERSKWLLFLFSIPLIFLTCSSSYSQSVVIFENPNFGGRAKTVGVGEYRLLDFNDIASSIKVPTGLAAMIYEHADEGGGYGISVDLLEDCPDLSKYNFNDKVSYIVVFGTKRPGFFWARNSLRNGQFVAGHWERERASGPPPPNPIAVVSPPLPPHAPTGPPNPIVVSPPLPPHAPTGPTTIQVNDAQFTITSLGVQSPADAAIWDHADKDLMGVIGSDYRGIEEIGSAAFQRASHNRAIPDSINFWYPQKQPNDHIYFKRTLSGTIAGSVEGESAEPHIANVNGTYDDHDLNIDIKPSSNYMYLITQAHRPSLSLQQATELRGESIWDLEAKENPCTKPFKVVEAEIDQTGLTGAVFHRIGKQIAVYGPWIYDKGHCYHPEIHPAEQIWWSEDVGANKKYNLNLFCDSSGRFWWRSQMDDGTIIKPWAEPPIKGTFAIAFEADLGNKLPTKTFEVTGLSQDNVVEFPNSNKVYNLVYQNKALVSFVPKNNAFKVSYEKVGLKPGTTNIVHGFLVIETSVGTITRIQGSPPLGLEELAFKKVGGHYMFSILLTDTKIRGVFPTVVSTTVCEQERTNLANLQQSLKTEEANLGQLQSELQTAPPQQKPRLRQEILDKRAEIGQLKIRITQAEQLLQECEARPR